MKLHELRSALRKYSRTFPRFILPDGDQIPAHAHVTEVGHLVKNFVDCGGLIGHAETVVLQTHVGDDTEHRLTSDRFAKILRLGDRVLPHDRLEVEVEYDCCVVAQYPIAEVRRAGDYLDIALGKKRTQCLARERAQSPPAEPACCGTGSSCC
ncbi:MAG: DUF6428 family protein [Chthoniobacterales bacterium]